jgi:ring-1,2-phenylacetyl-CoA epoxidase subunit PaaD
MPVPEAAAAPRDAAPNASDAASVWRALGGVVDPEIPVVSIVELGIVRDVGCDGAQCIVTLTPTYSGCPAASAIESQARAAAEGATQLPVRVVTTLAPAWSSDWIAPEARRKLARYGIAPPGETTRKPRPAATVARPVACPNCGSSDTEEISRFGSTACKAQHRCRECAEPFDYFKPL